MYVSLSIYVYCNNPKKRWTRKNRDKSLFYLFEGYMEYPQ